MLSLLEECPVFKRNAIKGDRIQYTWNNSFELAN